MTLFSLIVPHYNDSNKLKRLLLSLPDRVDLQVIVIDDNSPDQLGLSDVKQQFKDFVFLSTPTNLGAGAARNIGLQYANGEFVLFADADDEFSANAFEVFDQAIESNADIYYFHAEAIIESTGEHSNRADAVNSLVKNYLETPNKERELDLRLKHCVPWAKLYNKSFVDKTRVRFDEVAAGNDVYFNVINGVLADTVYVSNGVVYRCYRLSDSLTSTLTKDRLLCRIKASSKVAAELKRLGVKHDRSASGFIVQSLSFGIPVFFKVVFIAVKSDLHLNLARVVNICRWKRFFKRKHDDNSEITREENNL